MTSPEEIKKELELSADCSDYDGHHIFIVRDALEYINKLEQRLASVGKTFPKWISVNDRLPKDYDDVLVTVRNDGAQWTMIAYLAIGGIWGLNGGGRFFGVVTHWMPLPEPPKED